MRYGPKLYTVITTAVVKFVLSIHFRLFGKVKRSEVVLDGVEPPFLVVANHQTELDPFYIGTNVPGRISFLATDSLFKNRFVRAVMSALGSIPKSKLDVDPAAIRKMIESVKHGWSVGLFPEGQRSMAGYTDDIAPTVGRLAKMLDVPVVAAKLQGGFLARPCWAYWGRRGRCILNVKLLFSKEQVRQLKPDEIQKAVADSLHHSDFEWIRKNPRLRYRGKNRAHGLHNIMFLCPECGSRDCFKTRGDVCTCKVCGYSVRWGDRGEFILMNGSRLHHENLELQDKWQKSEIRLAACQSRATPGRDLIHGPCKVTVRRQRKSGPMETIGTGEVVLYEDAICVVPDDGNHGLPAEFGLNRVRGFSVEAIRGRRNRIVEFLYEGDVYSLVFHNELESTYEWHLMVRSLQAEARAERQARSGALQRAAKVN